MTWSRMTEVKVGAAWGRFPVGVTHWREPGSCCAKYRGATGVQLSRPESAISGLKTTKRETERVDLEELHSAIKPREVSSLSLLAQSFQRKKREVNAKVQDSGEGTVIMLAIVNCSQHSHCQGVREEKKHVTE